MITSASFDKGMASKVTSSGGYTYIAQAEPPGATYANRTAHEAAAVWRVIRVDSNGSGQWAGGTDEFVHVATDLTALDYLD